MPENDPIVGSPDAADAQTFEDMFGMSTGGDDAIDTAEPDQGQQPPVNGSPDQGNQDQKKADDSDADAAAAAAVEGGDDAGNDQNPYDPKKDKERFEYWQSRYDKTVNELQTLKKEVEDTTPLLKYMQENPELAQEIYGKVRDHLNGQQTQGSSADSVDVPQRPEKPTKPSNYDPMDAVSSPESESFKYREQLAEYQEQLTEYNEALIQAQKAEKAKQDQEIQQNKAVREKAKAIYDEARYRHNMDAQQAADFVRWSMNPEYTVEDLISVYNARQREAGKTSQKAQQTQQKNKTVNSPPPPAASGNSVETKKQEVSLDDSKQMGELFVNSLFEQVGQ